MKFIQFIHLLLASVLLHVSADGEVHSCACEAEELGFTIDCTSTDVMMAALSDLQSGGCASDCTSDECVKNWFIVQSHHDYCPEDSLPMDLEDSFHDYDEVCVACEIGRQPVEGLPDCPAVNCDDESAGNIAYTSLIADGCLTNGCDATLCRDNYFILKGFHDNCPHDVLTSEADEGIHDVEDACVAASVNCNSAGGGLDENLVCVPHDHEDPSGSPETSVLSSFVVVATTAMSSVLVIMQL